MADEQQELVKIFSKRDLNRFSQIKWDFTNNQVPVIEGAFATLECETFQTVEAGDHTILIGSVKNITTKNKNPLLYHRRRVGPIPLEFYD